MQPDELSDLHCSLGDGRSFTDPVSNWVLISGLQIDRHAANLLQIGNYPSRYLPDFLHEFVHHWCFHSPVGAALAFLQMRAFRTAMLKMKEEEIGEKDALEVAEDFIRYETAITLMRPLAEGLALFAEFDTAPGDSPVLSLASMVAGTHFLDMSGPDVSPAQSWENVRYLLAARRMEEDFCDRKANLLVQPFHTRKGGYLPGYLTLKSLRQILIQSMESPKFEDPDLFLTYIRSFFYEDYELVAVLLDPETALDPWSGRNDSAQAISRYFQKRFAQLVHSTTEERVERFEQAVSRGATFDWDDEAMGADPQKATLGRERLYRMLEEINFDGPPDTLEKVLKRSDHFLFAQRDLMCIGSFPAPVEVNEHGRALVGEYRSDSTGDFRIPLLSIPALEGVPPRKGDGSLEFFLSVNGRYSLSTVTLGDEIVAVNSLSDNFTEDLKKQVTGYWTSQASVTHLRKLRLTAIGKALEEPTVRVYTEHYRQNCARVTDETYATRALLFTPDSHLARCRELLHEHGLYEVLGGDPDFIRTVALVSLLVAFTPDRERVSELLAERGIGLDAILNRLRDCWDSHRLPIILEPSEGVLQSYL